MAARVDGFRGKRMRQGGRRHEREGFVQNISAKLMLGLGGCGEGMSESGGGRRWATRDLRRHPEVDNDAARGVVASVSEERGNGSGLARGMGQTAASA